MSTQFLHISDSDEQSLQSEAVSGQFGIKPIRTPGFKDNQKFVFGEENKAEQSSSSSGIHTDSDSDSLGDEISSMHSDFTPQVRHFGLKSNHKDSFSSSEMERNFSDDGLSLPKLESAV